MDRLFNVNIADIIKWEQTSPNFNDELLIVKLEGLLETDAHERVQIDAFTLMLVLDGTLDIDINGNDYHVESKAFLDVLDIHSVKNIRQSHDFKGYHVILSKFLIEEAMRGIKRLPLSNFLARYNRPIMELNDDDSMLLEHILLKLIESIYRVDHVYQRDLVKNELRSLFLEVSNILVQKDKIQNTSKFRSREEIAAQFVIMMSANCKEQHSVNFYAKELCVEPKYLSRVLKAINGKTASCWIDEAIVRQAKILLKDQDLTIQQIVDTLHFSDQSAFGKFFKKHSGVSPLIYRRG